MKSADISHARPMWRLIRVVFSATSAFALGCVAQVDDHSTRDTEAQGMPEAHIAEALERMGIDSGSSVILPEHDAVRVQDDMLVRIGDLLERDKLMRDVASADGMIQKGYIATFTPPVSRGRSRNIKLAWATGDTAPHQVLKATFTAAGDAWSNASFGGYTAYDLSIRPDNSGASGATITIHQVSPEDWDETGCGPNADACAQYVPLLPNSTPANNIYVRAVKEPCAWTFETLRAMALHELGHAIGLWHPGEPVGGHDAIHVDGTGQCSSDPRWAPGCPWFPPYETIMTAILWLSSNCTPAGVTSLTDDDKLTVSKVY